MVQTGRGTIRYLSTLSFSDRWLTALIAAGPGVEVTQIPATTNADVPAATWAEVEVLHTGSVLPDPGLAPLLRWVQLDTAGVDHLHGLPVWDSDVELTTIGGVSPTPMAEYVMMMVLASSHNLAALTAAQRRRDWPSLGDRWRMFMPRGLRGATIGVVGYGRIGREVGRLARAFGMQVIGVRRSPPGRGGVDGGGREEGGHDEAGTEVVGIDSLEEVLPRCDFVVVTVPLTDATTHLLGPGALRAVRPGAYLINVARGGVIDEVALTEALDDHRLCGAALDVFAEEPLPPDSTLWDHPDVTITPHVAGFAPDYETAVLELVTDNLRRYLAGTPLTNRVDRHKGY